MRPEGKGGVGSSWFFSSRQVASIRTNGQMSVGQSFGLSVCGNFSLNIQKNQNTFDYLIIIIGEMK